MRPRGRPARRPSASDGKARAADGAVHVFRLFPWPVGRPGGFSLKHTRLYPGASAGNTSLAFSNIVSRPTFATVVRVAKQAAMFKTLFRDLLGSPLVGMQESMFISENENNRKIERQGEQLREMNEIANRQACAPVGLGLGLE